MNVAILFAALGVAIVAWFLMVRRLRTKPWIEKGTIDLEDGIAGLDAERVGL